MSKIFCVEFQRYPLKFHTKYLTHTLKDVQCLEKWRFKSSQIYELVSVFETPPNTWRVHGIPPKWCNASCLWFRQCLVAYFMPRYYLKQCWYTVNWKIRNIMIYYYTPRFNEVESGVYWDHLVRLSVHPSVRPSVRLWTEWCPLCIFNNTHRIHFIFAHLVKQLQKACHV